MELHDLLTRQRLTTLRLRREDWTAELGLSLEVRWDPNVDWSRFSRDFRADDVPVTNPVLLGDREARQLVRAHGLGHNLAALEALMIAGRHEMIVLNVEPRLGMRAAHYIHSSLLGLENGLHAIRAGGYRRHEPDEAELAVFGDGLNLGRAMSYKNAAAELPLGGSKMTVQCDPIALDDFPRLGFLAYCIEDGRLLTGPDMGFLPEHTDVLRDHFTHHATGGRRGALGPTGGPTALGCFLAIQEAAELALGSRDLRGKRAAVQGLGAVGLPLATHLKEAGMSLVVADLDDEAIAVARDRLGEIDVVRPQAILTAPCDILAPCAVGGILDEAVIASLRCRMVYGSANNPLKATSTKEELRLAEILQERNILFQIEWTHNTAGVMAGFEEYIRGDRASLDQLRPRLERVCRDGTRRILADARSKGATPTKIAYDMIERKIYAANDP